MNQINNTQDIKAATDLQNRIAVEQAKIANNQIKLDMFDRCINSNRKLNSVDSQLEKLVWLTICAIGTTQLAISKLFFRRLKYFRRRLTEKRSNYAFFNFFVFRYC